MRCVCVQLTPLHNTHFILLCVLELINWNSELWWNELLWNISDCVPIHNIKCYWTNVIWNTNIMTQHLCWSECTYNLWFTSRTANVCLRVDHGWKTMARGPDPAHTIFCSDPRVNVGTYDVQSYVQTEMCKRQHLLLKWQHFFWKCTRGTFLRNKNFSKAARSGVWFPTVVLHVNFKFSC